MRTFVLPDLGEGLQEAEIVAWHVAAGDHVVADQPLVSVETAKAVIDIPAPWSGRVVQLFGSPHDVIAVGAKLAEIETEGVVDTGTVVGQLPVAPTHEPRSTPHRVMQETPRAIVRASPAVRRRAAELSVDLAEVAGSGPGGAITMTDVESGGSRAGAGTTRLQVGYEPLRGVRRAMAEAMAKVAREVVAASLMDEAIVETWAAGIDPTTRLVRAMVAGCQAAPSLNAWFDPVGRSRRLHDHIDLGIALESADGLFVPVIRNVAGRGPEDLRGALQTLKRQVSERTIARADLQGQTITLSNFGMLGGRHAVLTVMPPQVAILGAGRIHRAVRPLGEEIKVVSVLPLSLSFDHRAVTGAEACAFMAAAVADLSKSS